MKRILFLLLFALNGSMVVLGQNNELVRRDPIVAEQLCNQHFNIEQFKKEAIAVLNSGLVAELGGESLDAMLDRAYRVIRVQLIHSYMKGKTDGINFTVKMEKLKKGFYDKMNARYEVGNTTLVVPQVGLVPQNSFVAGLKREFKAHHHFDDEPVYETRAAGEPCTNPNFETCDFTNWELIIGTVPANPSQPFTFTNPTPTTSFSTVNSSVAVVGGSGYDQHYIVNGGTDAIGGFPMVYPGGTCSAAIGDFNNYNYGASQMRQTFLVSSGDAILTLNYAVCLEDAGHTAAEQPYFRMRVYDQAGNSISCAEYEAVAGDGQAGWVNTGTWQYKPWTTVFIPLAPYLGQNVTVEFTVGDCGQGGHAGYAYVDASCNAMALNMSANAVCAGQPITITGPAGAAGYLWNTGATTQAITTSTPGTYSVTVTPVTGSSCSITIDTTVSASPNPIANFSDDAPVCVGVPVNFTDLSNPNGSTIGTWAWDFGDGGTSALQNPTHAFASSGNFNVTLTVTSTAGCTNSITIPVTINNGGIPTINPAGPFCSTDPATVLTGSIAGGTWSATCVGCINAATGSFDPAAAGAGSHTVTYTITGACSGSDTEVIQVESISLTSVTPTDVLCFGQCTGQIVIVAPGATQFSSDGGTTFQASGTFGALCAGNYNMVAQTALGCQVTAPAAITEPAVLTLPTAFTDESCVGSCDGSAIVAPQGGTAPYSYVWSNGGGNVPALNGLCAGVYTVTVTDNNGCMNAAPITVSSPAPVVITNIATTQESCQGACDGSITITAPLATQFSIDNGVTFQASNVFNGVCSGNYTVVVQNNVPCQATGNAVVTAPNAMVLNSSNDTTICIGGTATISANVSGGTAPVNLIWDNGLPNGSPHNVSPAVNTTYSVFAQDANGCFTPPQTITVSINPPLAVVASNDVAICPGQNANISAVANGGNGGPYTYVWDDGAGNILNGANQTVSPAATTTYTVTVSDNCGTPVATDQVVVTVNPNPVVTFTADLLSGCTPVPVNFNNTTAIAGTCSWDFGDGTTSSNCADSHVFTAPGCYDISLTVTSPAGCVGTLTQNQYICVYPYPVADFIFGPQPANIMDPEIDFINTSTGATIYNWDFAGLGTSTQTNPTFTFPATGPGNYNVCLEVENQYGCMDDICKIVVIDDYYTIYVPNAFTPDGDGINDYFLPILDGIDPESYELMVFNRWGELIYQTQIVGAFWDGMFRGQMSKEDVYVWKIKVTDNIEREKRVYYGHVSLLK